MDRLGISECPHCHRPILTINEAMTCGCLASKEAGAKKHKEDEDARMAEL
jgi:hypothetical protein